MAISFGFGSEKSKSSGQSNTKTTRDQKQTGTQDTTGTQTEQVTTLSKPVQNLITTILTSLGKDVKGGALGDQAQGIADLLTQRAQGADTANAENIAAIVGEQERSGRMQIERLFTDLAQQVGSSQGSLVRQAAAEGEASLASQLAATEGGLNMQARQSATQELMTALQGVAAVPGVEGAQVQNLTNLANILKGATTTGTTQTQQNVTTEQQLQDIINSLTTSSSSSKSSGFKIGF